MRKPRLPEAKIKEILAEQASGISVGEIVKKHKISPATFYNWKSKYGGGGEAATAKRGRPKGAKTVRAAAAVATVARGGGSMADENRRLKVLVVDLMLENERLKEQLGRA